jgi:hypothetical protein
MRFSVHTEDRKEHQPTKSELKARADWEEQRRKWPSAYDKDKQHWCTWDYFLSGRLSLTLTDPLRSQWESGHLLGRWYDRKVRSLETYLNNVLVGMLTGAAIVRHNRIAAETARRQKQEAHKAHMREPWPRKRQPPCQEAAAQGRRGSNGQGPASRDHFRALPALISRARFN